MRRSGVRSPVAPLIIPRISLVSDDSRTIHGASDEVFGQRRERFAEAGDEVLRFVDVHLGRREPCVTGALFDAQRVVAAHGHPGDPGRSKIVKRDVLLPFVVGEEVGALHVRLREVLAQHDGAVLVRGHHSTRSPVLSS
jgi:hypothetical protein